MLVLWRPVDGWPYEVSNTGQVRSLPRRVAMPNGGDRVDGGSVLAPTGGPKSLS